MLLCGQMASHTELMILVEEERVLVKLASKLNDQLNRLKVRDVDLCFWHCLMVLVLSWIS